MERKYRENQYLVLLGKIIIPHRSQKKQEFKRNIMVFIEDALDKIAIGTEACACPLQVGVDS